MRIYEFVTYGSFEYLGMTSKKKKKEYLGISVSTFADSEYPRLYKRKTHKKESINRIFIPAQVNH